MSRIFMIFSTVISDISMVPFSDIKLILPKPTTMGATVWLHTFYKFNTNLEYIRLSLYTWAIFCYFNFRKQMNLLFLRLICN